MNGSITSFAVLGMVLAGLAYYWGKDRDNPHKWERISACIAALSVVIMMLGMANVLGAVWQLIGTSAGITTLVVIALVSGFLAYRMVYQGGIHHHTKGTYAVSVILAVAVGLIIGGWKVVLAGGTKQVTGAGQGLGKVLSGSAAKTTQTVGHGHAAHTVQALSTGEGKWMLVLLVVAIAIAVRVYWKSHKIHTGGDGGQQAVTGGGNRRAAGRGQQQPGLSAGQAAGAFTQ